MAFLLGRDVLVDGQAVLLVNSLFVPEQRGEKDSVCALEGSDLVPMVSLLEREHLQVKGWIHSHPTFDSFLSSVDQHQQHLFQRLDPRCIAINTDKEERAFYYKLTARGMQVCSECTEAGFHEHPEPRCNLYEEADVKVVSDGRYAQSSVFHAGGDVAEDAGAGPGAQSSAGAVDDGHESRAPLLDDADRGVDGTASAGSGQLARPVAVMVKAHTAASTAGAATQSLSATPRRRCVGATT